jgi:hypothetical protein
MGSLDWIDMAQDRDQWKALVNTVMNLRVPYNIVNFLSSCTTGGFSRRLSSINFNNVTTLVYNNEKIRTLANVGKGK